MKLKYHNDSGAFEYYQTPDDLELKKASDSNKELIKENEKLSKTVDSLVEILKKNNLISEKDAKLIVKE
jgi:hypothetical protein